MFDYTIDSLPSGDRAVWSYLPLQPLAPGPLTPFSYSVLAEIAGRAWFQFYDHLDFDPTPRARVVRQVHGRPYLNLTLSAKLEAEWAGIEPLTLRLNGKMYPVAGRERAGFWGGMKQSRAGRRLEEALQRLDAEMDAVTARAHAWLARTQELRWTQADLLQIMEEIEWVGLDSLAAFLAARSRVELGYNRLLNLTAATTGFPASLNLINEALAGSDLVETKIGEAVFDLADLARRDSAVLAWLQSGDPARWREEMPSPELQAALDRCLAAYGHRAAQEGEMRHPRWSEEAAPLVRALRAAASRTPQERGGAGQGEARQRLLDAVPSDHRKQVGTHLQQIERMLSLQSRALDALLVILAGTRRWALAAGREAAGDGRLAAPDDVFFFELEEMKEMMTGEWNVSDLADIQKTAQERKTAYAQWRRKPSAALLIGDREAAATHPGLPGAAGRVSAPLQRWEDDCAPLRTEALVAVERLDGGRAPLLPAVLGLIAADGSPCDPVAAAARSWRTPTLLAIGERWAALADGAQTVLDVDHISVNQ